MPRFDLDELLEIVESTASPGCTSPLRSCSRSRPRPQIEDRDTSRLKMVISGRRPLDADLARRAEERIGCPDPAGLRDDRAQPGEPQSRLARIEETPRGSIGALIPNTEARLVDPETGEDVAEGEEGEIWIRGPQVMRGYLNNDEATARGPRRRRLDPDR